MTRVHCNWQLNHVSYVVGTFKNKIIPKNKLMVIDSNCLLLPIYYKYSQGNLVVSYYKLQSERFSHRDHTEQ